MYCPNKMKIIYRYCILFFYLFVHFDLVAQIDSLTPEQDTIFMKEIEIKGENGYPNSLIKTLSYLEVDKKFILQNQGNTFINTLEKLPGISSINTGVGISKPVIRGMSFNRVIVNEYGVKQEGQQWGIDHGLEIDQYNVEEVEIVKGPVSLLYGSEGIGGVINILKPKIKTGNYFNSDVFLNYRSNNDTYGSSLLLEGAKKSLFGRVRITVQQYGDYKVPANEFTYNSYKLPILDNRLKNTAGKELNFSFFSGVRKKWGTTSVYISRYGQKAGFFSGAFGIPRAYQLTNDGDKRNINLPYQNIQHYKVISNTTIFIKKSTLDIDAGYQKNTREEHSPPDYHDYGPKPEGSLALKLILNTSSIHFRVKTILMKNWQISYGLSGQIQQNKRGGYEFLIPEYKAKQIGMFFLNEIKINPRLYGLIGMRGDWAKQTIQKTLLPIYDTSLNITGYTQRSPLINRNYFNFSGAMGLAFQITEKHELKYNIGTAYRVPGAPELTSNGVHHGTFRHEMGDSTLNTERGYMQDIGFNSKTKKIKLSLSPFSYYFTNYIYLSPSAKFSPLADAGQIYQYTEAPVWMNGVEYYISFPLTKRFNILNSLEYVWNKNLKSNLPLPFTPPFSILGELGYKHVLSGRLKENQIAATGQYFSAQNRVDRNEIITPGYFLININYSATLKLGKQKLTLYIIARNITNQKYINNMSRYRTLNLPEQGFNFSVMIRLII